MLPEIRRAWKNLLNERQDSFHVDFLERRRVPVNASQREFLTEFIALTRVGLLVDRLGEQEGVVETIEPLLDHADASFGSGRGGA